MKLNFRTLGEGQPLIIMHGVFGSSDNWQTLGKDFSEHFKVFLVDLRNHGKSPHSDTFNYHVMVEDVLELMRDERIYEAYILGHSMGGKVAMNLATKNPSKVKKLMVVDIAPKDYPPHHQQIFKGFRSIDLKEVRSRKDADNQMAEVISNFGVRQFILKNLDRDSDGNFGWKLNIDAIEKNAEMVGNGLDIDAHFEGDTLFIAGGNSDYILDEDREKITAIFPKADIKTILGAGHWVHAEKPNELRDAVVDFLK